MKLTFWGAAKTVTGSMHEVAVDGERFLLDCGLYQGRREESFDRNRNLAVPGRKVSAVVLSHAHIDHSGNLPSLARSGFGGWVYATPPTKDLCDSMLRDSAFLQEKDAEFVNKRFESRKKRREPVEPLYSMADAEKILQQFRPVPYHNERPLTDSLSYTYYDAGHLLGSTFVALTYRNGKRDTRLVFSGDVGRNGLPIIRDPESPAEADYLILESTYGNRLHKKDTDVVARLAEIINRTAQRGGKIIVPAFAVGRTQQLVLLLHQLISEKTIPPIPVFVDSPLAVNATEAYRKHTECYDAETRAYLESGDDPFGFRMLRYVREASESKTLNSLKGPMVIISASGMCEAGRILHHLRNNVEDPRNTVLIVGFQAEHTLGRKLVEKHQEVNIFGEPVRVRSEVVVINELSGHADQQELIDWMRPLAKRLKRVFLVHGEVEQSQPLAARIRETYGVDTVVPDRGDSFILD